MTDQLTERGIVLSTTLLGEYDKRLVILTEHLGKITVFANGARRANSRFTAASQSFIMGSFTFRQGRSTYTLTGAEILESFLDLTMDPEKYAAAAYVSELTEGFTRENLPGKDELNLLYVTFKKLLEGNMPPDAIRAAFLYKLLHIEGVAPGMEDEGQLRLSESGRYAVRYIYSRPIGATYSFQMSNSVAAELLKEGQKHAETLLEHPLRSAEILEGMRAFEKNS